MNEFECWIGDEESIEEEIKRVKGKENAWNLLAIYLECRLCFVICNS